MIHILGRVQVPQLVKQVIQYRELTSKAHSRLVWELDEPVMHQYAVGNALENLVPPSAKVDTDLSENYDEPLFNKKNHLKIMEPVGQHGLLHIQLMPKKFLKSIFVEPDSIAVDLVTSNSGALIYEFYNPTPVNSIIITATCADDKENIYSKIRTNSEDLEYRQYFIRKALKKTDYGKLEEPKTTYPEIMTAEQVALYLQLKLSTVRNKTSAKELPSVKIAGSTRYKKSAIDALIKSN
jgi:excisionase family DNA binding protein